MVAVVILLRVLAVVVGTSYQMLEVLAFCNWERAQPPSISITVLTFLVKKSSMKNFGVSINFSDNTQEEASFEMIAPPDFIHRTQNLELQAKKNSTM